MVWPFKTKQPEQKASRTGRAIHLQTMGRPRWTPREYGKLAKESYQQNAIAYRCVRLVSEACAQMPLLVKEGDETLETHPFLDLIKRPNPFEGQQELLISLYSFVLLAGNAYLEPIILDGNIRELFSLRPDRMTISVGPRGYPSAYIYTVGQNPVKYTVNQSATGQLPILHVKTFHPTDDNFGLSPVEPAAFAIDVHNESNAFAMSLLQNGARPSGALVYDGGESGTESLTDEQFTRLKNEISENYSGAKNAGRPLVLDGGLSWEEMSMQPKDMEQNGMHNQAAREIALAFGVPPMMLGIPGDLTYSNYQEANRAFYRQTVIPFVNHVYGDFTSFFSPTYGDTFEVVTDIDDIEALASERAERWTRINESQVLTIDEKRAELGYDDYERDEDVGASIFGPMSMSPLSADEPDNSGDDDQSLREDPFDDDDNDDDPDET